MVEENDSTGEAVTGLPFVVAYQAPRRAGKRSRQPKQKPPAPGDRCPQCGQGRLDYDGLLHLSCAGCGYTLTGGAGCT